MNIAVRVGDSPVRGASLRASMVTRAAWIHEELDLVEGRDIQYEVIDENGLLILWIEKDHKCGDDPDECIWMRQSLRPVSIQLFSPTNPDWAPNTEPDVYLAFANLQEFTGYQYCRGYTVELGRRLGYQQANGKSKPDSVLIESGLDEYRMAEFKIRSTDYVLNHDPEDVDVLVCWHDDEEDRTKLPPAVVCLRDIAREVGSKQLHPGIE